MCERFISAQGIELMTGGFSAEYGNRLSGVFNMQTKSIPQGHPAGCNGKPRATTEAYTFEIDHQP